MFLKLGKRIVAFLPAHVQTSLRRYRALRQFEKGRHVSDEPEFKVLTQWIGPEDWVLDLGANVGHYTCEFARIVGPSGRVIAFEPIPTTFAVLSAVVERGGFTNVTLVNAAVSSQTGVVRMTMPAGDSGLPNYYQASIGSGPGREAYQCLAFAVDDIALPHRVALAKIDVEGHEESVLSGMQRILARDRPILIVEGTTQRTTPMFEGLGYAPSTLPGSPNTLFIPKQAER